ncbi:hypothetical protein [Wolbachia endosymbiont of Tettigetta isshikii]|uniref:hypothetical protein n=1 Tax=Wolbachia endosymbiont of Tettigetta isshikii TaxID=3239093 RepID=UPI00397F102A
MQNHTNKKFLKNIVDKKGNIKNIDKRLSVMKGKLKKAYPCDDKKNHYERLNKRRRELASELNQYSTGKEVQPSI